jgi:hypothetical protein
LIINIQFSSKTDQKRQWTLDEAGRDRDIPDLLLATAKHLTSIQAGPSSLTPPEYVHRMESCLRTLSPSTTDSITSYFQPPDVTADPEADPVPIKTMIRAKPAWRFRDLGRKGGQSFSNKRCKRGRFDHIFFRDSLLEGFEGIGIGRVKLFYSVELDGVTHELAYIEEYQKSGRDKASRFWRLNPRTRQLRGRTVRQGRVISISSILSAAHVIPQWKTVNYSAARWQLFDNISSKFYLNHFVHAGIWDLVEDVGL